MYATAPLPADRRDMSADFNDFESMPGGPLPVPNGVVQIHLQTSYDGTLGPPVDNWEIKALRIVKLDPDTTEVARLDGKSGFSQRFNSPFVRNTDTGIVVDGTEYFPNNTDQLQRFDESGFLLNSAFRINTDDDDAFGGVGIWQSGVSTAFDASDAMIEVRAKLTAPLAEQAPTIRVIAKDRDGNGTAEVGDFGGEEYHFNVALDQFNENSMTTIALPFTAAIVEQAQEFATPGDGLLSDFNLYYLGMLTEQDAGLVDLEVEYVRVVLPPPAGVPGDYNNNGTVDAADYVLWRKGGPLENEGDAPGTVNMADYNFWRSRFGAASGSGAALDAANVPEPSSAIQVMWMTACYLAAPLATRVPRR